MTITSKTAKIRSRYHAHAYRFVFSALKYAQEVFQRPPSRSDDKEQTHISGQQLLHGIRLYASQQYGLLARTVFNRWGIFTTEDFGRIVFELIEQGEMKKTQHDQLDDFCDIYDFEEVLERQYSVDVSQVFSD